MSSPSTPTEDFVFLLVILGLKSLGASDSATLPSTAAAEAAVAPSSAVAAAAALAAEQSVALATFFAVVPSLFAFLFSALIVLGSVVGEGAREGREEKVREVRKEV